MMTRNFKDLDKEFDVIIVGGGIYGTAMAWEAVARGLSVVLFEKKDFVSATSSNSLKIIHGGLRYLQSLDIKRVLESVRERKVLLGIAPHLIQPLPCIMPTYGMTMKSKHVMWAGMLVNDILSCDRNIGLDPQRKLPNCRVLSRSASQKLLPALTDGNYTGSACWYDGQAYNTERLPLSYLLSAVDKGALAFNYTRVDGFLRSGDKVTGVKIVDQLSGNELEVRGKMVVTTAGPWTNTLMGMLNGKSTERFVLSKAINLVLKRKISNDLALGITSKIVYEQGVKRERAKRRQLFITPWRDYTVVGTTHLPWSGNPDEYRVSESDIQDFLLELNDLLPETKLERSDVTFVHGGVLPLVEEPVPGQDVKLMGHYHVVDQAKISGIEGLMNVVGVKYTTARDVAEKVMAQVARKLGTTRSVFSTRTTPLIGANIGSVQDFMNTSKVPDVSPETALSLLRNYGTEFTRITSLYASEPELKEPVADGSHVIAAQVVHAIRYEGAQKLSDVVLRRTDLGSGEQPSDQALETCAKLMARELGWDPERMASEIRETLALYQPAKG